MNAKKRKKEQDIVFHFENKINDSLENNHFIKTRQRESDLSCEEDKELIPFGHIIEKSLLLDPYETV
jgi:hypothetical protein